MNTKKKNPIFTFLEYDINSDDDDKLVLDEKEMEGINEEQKKEKEEKEEKEEKPEYGDMTLGSKSEKKLENEPIINNSKRKKSKTPNKKKSRKH